MEKSKRAIINFKGLGYLKRTFSPAEVNLTIPLTVAGTFNYGLHCTNTVPGKISHLNGHVSFYDLGHKKARWKNQGTLKLAESKITLCICIKASS